MRLTSAPTRLIEEFFPSPVVWISQKEAQYSRSPVPWTWRARRTDSVVLAMSILACLPPGEEETFWKAYEGKETLSRPLILDAFCGTGTTIRCSISAGAVGIGGDISRLACVNSLVSVGISPDFVQNFCEEEIWPRIRHLFLAECFCGRETDRTVFYYGTEYVLEDGKTTLTVSPVFFERGVLCDCGEVAVDGFCPNCGVPKITPPGKQLEAANGRARYVSYRLLFVSGICPQCGKFVRRASSKDEERLKETRVSDETFLKRISTPLLSKSWRPYRKQGVTTVADLLTERGKASLYEAFRVIEQKVLDTRHRLFLELFVLNATVRTMSRLSKYSPSGLIPLSGHLVFSPVFCESSPIRGRGFVSLSRSLKEAFPRKTTGKPLVYQGDATRLPFPSMTFDAIITDPPYENLIDYQLSEELAAPVIPPSPSPSLSFAETMLLALKECARVLKPGGVIVFTFQHPQQKVWRELALAIRGAGLKVSAVHAAINDRSHLLGKEHKRADTIIVCRQTDSVYSIPPAEYPGDGALATAVRKGLWLACLVNGGQEYPWEKEQKWIQKSLL